MSNSKSAPSPSKLVDFSNRFLSAIDEDRRAEVLKRLKPMHERLSLGIFRMLVMGEIKKGKTSFISSLLGEYDLLPTDVEIATSTVYKILYGPELKIEVFFVKKEEDDEPLSKVISPHELWHFGTEQYNSKNEHHVDFIAIQLPNPLLRTGLAIIDTPGLGGLFKQHQEITHRYVPRADGVFFILDSVESLISQDEISAIKGILAYTNQIVFIQTKTSIADSSQVAEWKKRNLAILSPILDTPPSSIPYFTIDSKLKREADQCKDFISKEAQEDRIEDLKDSGFSYVYRYLHHHLLPSKEDLLASFAIKHLRAEISAEGTQIQERMNIVRDASKENLQSIESTLQDTLKKLKTWQQTEFRELERRFQESAEDLKVDCRNRIMWKFDPQGIEFDAYFHNICRKLNSDLEISKQSQQILSDYASHCTLEGKTLIEGYYHKFSALIENTIKNSIGRLQDQINVAIPEAISAEIDATPIDDDAIKSGLLQGSMAGGFVTGAYSLCTGHMAAVFGLTIAAPPILFATAIVATSIFFGLHGYRKVKNQKFKRATNELKAAMAKTTHLARQAVLKEFDEISRSIERSARDMLGQIFYDVQNELNERLEEVRRTKERTAAENMPNYIGCQNRYPFL
jgi:hypothetical protein